MALRIVPAEARAKHFSVAKETGAPSVPGLHDTLRAGLGPAPRGTAAAETGAAGREGKAPATDSDHPLEARVAGWRATQDALRLELLRRTFGIAEPARREMELRVVRAGSGRPAVLGGGGPSLHEDILTGRDTTIDWEDVFVADESTPILDFHAEMERKMGI